MNADRFDTLARTLLSIRSRRAALGALGTGFLGLLGWVDTHDVAAKNCKKIKDKKKRKKCLAKARGTVTQPSCIANCAGRTCGDDGCGRSCGPCETDQFCDQGQCSNLLPPPPCANKPPGADCGAGRICAQDQCVTGQGTCETGEDFCKGNTDQCSDGDCSCWTTTGLQTRCGENTPLTTSGECSDDSDCVSLFPNTPGVFCALDDGPECAAGGSCVAPCCQGEPSGTNCGPAKICIQGECIG